MYSYTYTSQDEVNMYASCLNNDRQKFVPQINDDWLTSDQGLQHSIDAKGVKDITTVDVDQIIDDYVSIPLNECKNYLARCEAPYLPLTMTTYRAVAFKKFRNQVMDLMKTGANIKIGQLTSDFCNKVDR